MNFFIQHYGSFVLSNVTPDVTIAFHAMKFSAVLEFSISPFLSGLFFIHK